MVRWKPEARDRLQAAAFELFAEQGFEDTTVAQIAEAVGLTERTFYRHFADKREVLFGGQDQVRQAFADGAAAAAADAAPLLVVQAAVAAGAAFFAGGRRPWALLRHRVVAATPELRERELLKMASLASVLVDALHDRGIAEPAATLAAESGALVFRVAFDEWITSGTEQPLTEVISAVFEELGAVTSASTSS